MGTAIPASADVIEIDPQGQIHLRTPNGPVEWIDASIQEIPAEEGVLPAAAVSSLSGFAPPVAYAPALLRAAGLAGIGPALLEAVVWQESRWHPGARSPKGAMGLGQLMPDTARRLGVDPRDPQANLMGTALYLRAQLDRFDNNLELALAAYNAGPGRVERAGAIPDIAETRGYVAKITARLASASRLP